MIINKRDLYLLRNEGVSFGITKIENTETYEEFKER